MRKRDVIFLGLVLVVAAAVTTFAVPLTGADRLDGRPVDCGTVASRDERTACDDVVNQVRLAAAGLAGLGILVAAFGWLVMGEGARERPQEG